MKGFRSSADLRVMFSARALQNLGGMTVLYVGGRPAHLPHLRHAAAARST